MNQLLKPTVYWVSLFGGLSGVMAKVPHVYIQYCIYLLHGFGLLYQLHVVAVDTFCKICSRRFDDIPHDPRRKKVFPCGHSDVKKVCEMCYRRSGVLHPGLGEFTFGYHEPEPDLNYYSFDCGSTCCIRRG